MKIWDRKLILPSLSGPHYEWQERPVAARTTPGLPARATTDLEHTQPWRGAHASFRGEPLVTRDTVPTTPRTSQAVRRTHGRKAHTARKDTTSSSTGKGSDAARLDMRSPTPSLSLSLSPSLPLSQIHSLPINRSKTTLSIHRQRNFNHAPIFKTSTLACEVI